jgi:cytochrome c peroxidase
VDLNGKKLSPPRLRKDRKTGVVWVPAFTDLKLYDITSGPDDPNREPLDMHAAPGSAEFFAGNSRFLTRKLWGIANEPPFFHHGQFTTMRQAIEAHAGEAADARAAWNGLGTTEQNAVIEFLKTLQVLEAGTERLVVDENGRKRKWRDFPYDLSRHLP